MKHVWLFVVIGIALLMAAVFWWRAHFEWREETTVGEPHGEAQYNPLFVLQQALRAQGVKVSSKANLDFATLDLQPTDSIVYAGDIRALSNAQVMHIEKWVREGGQFLFALPSVRDGGEAELTTWLGIYPNHYSGCWQWQAPEVGPPLGKYCPTRAFFLNSEDDENDPAKAFAWLWGDADAGYVLGQLSDHQGRWLIAADLAFMHNDNLAGAGNSELAWQILAPSLHSGALHLIYATNIAPWYVWLTTHGWQILLPLFITLLGILWARSQRFGPMLPAASLHRRALLEHIQAAGEFAFARGLPTTLYAPLRRQVFQRLRSRDPTLAAAENDNDKLMQALGKKFPSLQRDIATALNPKALANPDEFVIAMRTLLFLRENL
jgi:hypothetical protein